MDLEAIQAKLNKRIAMPTKKRKQSPFGCFIVPKLKALEYSIGLEAQRKKRDGTACKGQPCKPVTIRTRRKEK